MEFGEHPDIESAEGMSDQKVWSLLASGVHKGSQFFGNLHACAGFRSYIAPAVTCTVIRANARKLGDPRLNFDPVKSRNAHAAIQNHRGAARSPLQSMFSFNCPACTDFPR